MHSSWLFFIFIIVSTSKFFSQGVDIPDYFVTDSTLSDQILEIVNELGLAGDYDVGEDGIEQISLAVVDLANKAPVLAGYKYGNFIYPASVYKMYVAAEILHQISLGEYSLNRIHIVEGHNAVDKNKEIGNDPRPLIKPGDTVTVNYLLDLMITRSDNSAANCLIDIARREKINQLMSKYNWHGSEVTRKFLRRKFEDPGYENIPGTETCALHAADFMYKIETNALVDPWVSQQMKILLGRQLDNTKLTKGLPDNAVFYHKTGWYSFWTNDVGIVNDGNIRYIISCFLPLKEEAALPKFRELASRIHHLISNRNKH